MLEFFIQSASVLWTFVTASEKHAWNCNKLKTLARRDIEMHFKILSIIVLKDLLLI